MRRVGLIGKDSDARRDWGRRRRGRRGWDGWMASPTQWMWVWVNSRSWWWTGRPGVLQFMGLQRVRHDWATELNWTHYLNLMNLILGNEVKQTLDSILESSSICISSLMLKCIHLGSLTRVLGNSHGTLSMNSLQLYFLSY